MTNVTVILAPTASLAQSVSASISIEAEYGDVTVAGSRYTAAHHGANAANACPCIDGDIPVAQEGEIVLISHIDLDTVGGVGRALGHPAAIGSETFWALSAFVDTAGPHKLAESGASEEDLERLYAYWAWSQANRGPRRENDVVHDVTEEVANHLNALEKIQAGDKELLAAGREFKAAGERLNEESFAEVHGTTIVRVSPAFVNHLYTTPNGEVCEAVVAFNTKTGSVTLSFAEKDDPRSAAEIMRQAFGPEAGGHKGIAGSPRGVRQRLDSIQGVLAALAGTPVGA